MVVHSTDYAVVRDNVALQTKGHSYFTEALALYRSLAGDHGGVC